MAGSTSPVTLAGSLVQLNAEQLSGIVLTQLVRPGTPVLAGYIPGIADMRTGGYLGGAVEFGLMQAGAAQLAHFYQVPIYCSGGMTDAKLPDAQAGYEKIATFIPFWLTVRIGQHGTPQASRIPARELLPGWRNCCKHTRPPGCCPK
jgi:trimethylamine--corrinoid protein Co-methyltransferase